MDSRRCYEEDEVFHRPYSGWGGTRAVGGIRLGWIVLACFT